MTNNDFFLCVLIESKGSRPNLMLPGHKRPSGSLLMSVVSEYLFETGAILLSFLVARNSLVWLLESTLGWGPDFWQSKWEYLVDNTDRAHFYVGGGFVISWGVYWGWGGFYCLLDRTGWLSKYKVQPDTNMPPDTKKFMKVKLIHYIFL